MVELLGGRRAQPLPAGRLCGTMLDAHAAIKSLRSQEWTGSQKAVAADPLAADHAFQEERPVLFLDLAESADRGQRVADKLAIDRHQIGVPSQRDKFIEGRAVVHIKVPGSEDSDPMIVGGNVVVKPLFV